METMGKNIRRKTWLEKLILGTCGFMIVFAFLGMQINILGIPLYIFFLVLNMVLLLINNSMKIVIPNKVLPNNQLQFFCVMMIVMATILLPFSINKAGIQPYLSCCLTAFVIYVVYVNCKTKDNFETLLKYVLIGHLIVCIATQYELITGNHFVVIQGDYYERMGKNNAFGFQGNINDNATVLVMCLLSALYFLKRSPLLISGIVAWTVYLIFCIGSRMAIMAVLSIIVIAIMIVLLGKVAEYYSGVTKAVLFSLLLLAGILLLLVVDTDTILNTISNTQDYQSDAARLRFISSALRETGENSLFIGNGAGKTQHLIGYSIHSVLVEILCDYGIFVIIPLLNILIKMLMSFTKRIDTHKKIFIMVFVVVFVLMSFCSSSMLHILEPWIVLALVWRYYQTNVRACTV